MKRFRKKMSFTLFCLAMSFLSSGCGFQEACREAWKGYVPREQRKDYNPAAAELRKMRSQMEWDELGREWDELEEKTRRDAEREKLKTDLYIHRMRMRMRQQELQRQLQKQVDELNKQ